MTEYEENFSPFPSELKKLLSETNLQPFGASPKGDNLFLHFDVAKEAWNTISSPNLRREISNEARDANVTERQVIGRLPAGAPKDTSWIENYSSLDDNLRNQINEVFWNFGKAIAAFETGIIALNSPFDRFAKKLLRAGYPQNALVSGFGQKELAGLKLFLAGNCNSCHNGPSLSDYEFHNIGLANYDDELDLGRSAGIIQYENDPFNCLNPNPWVRSFPAKCYNKQFNANYLGHLGAVKTPTLRNVSHTGPYMHNGQLSSLDAVLAHYNTLSSVPAIGKRSSKLQPTRWNSRELQEIKAFLKNYI